MPLRVLHVAQPTVAGVAVCVHRFALDQAARGWDVSVACPPDGDLPQWLATSDVRHQPWRATRDPGLSTLGETRALARVIESVAPDVLHLHSSKAGLSGRLVRRRPTVVFQPHAWSFDVGGFVGLAAGAWERFAARRTDAVICVSEAERRSGEARKITANYTVIPNGVDLSEWPSADEGRRGAARSALGLSDAPTVVCVGRLSKQKGQDVLLESWRAVRATVARARLVLVGDGPEEGRLRELADESVTFAGRREDVSEWFAAADVVAIPSRWEGMSLSMLEAMASSRSIVATSAPGAAEALEGVAAVVPIADTTALAAALVERLTNPAMATDEGTRARQRVEERFDLSTTLAGIAQLYEALVPA